MRHRSSLPRFLASGLAAAGLVVGLTATQTVAAPEPTGHSSSAAAAVATGVTPTGADQAASGDRAALRAKPLSAAQRGAPAGLAPTGKSGLKRVKPATTNAAAAVTACTTADFASRSGAALVSYIKSVDWYTCINPLFDLTGSDANANGVFKESQMVAVANGVTSAAGSYTGDDSGGLHELLYFLRAGYYVQSNHPSDVGTYDSALTRGRVRVHHALQQLPRQRCQRGQW